MAVVCVQIILIVALYFQIQNTKNNTLGISINTIDSKTIRKTPSEQLKYFYEPKADTVIKNNEWEQYKGTYTINNDSLNERFNYEVKPKNKTFRIVILGDSYTYGLYVNTKDNWTEVLEDKLNNSKCDKKIDVINLGMEGYDPSYETERYRLRGTKYNPDLLIWFLVDEYRMTELIYEIMQKGHDELIKKGVGIFSRTTWVSAWKKVLDTYSKESIDLYQLGALRKINNQYKGKIIFLVQKTKSIKKPFSYMYQFKNERDNTEILEIINTFNNPNLQFSDTNHHPNIEGHKAIAEDVFNYLTKNNLPPCGK